tara:strand:- start:122 stop:499 length:378 start_codon:yes stop_codon:yes gene_type:complete
MSHFAEVDNNGVVQRVIVAEQDFINSGKMGDPNNWVQTSYNTRGGVHYAANSNEPDGGVALRKNHAAKGDTYDKIRDAFIVPRFYTNWNLNEETCQWEAPTPKPDDDKVYTWDEDATNWVEVRLE